MILVSSAGRALAHLKQVGYLDDSDVDRAVKHVVADLTNQDSGLVNEDAIEVVTNALRCFLDTIAEQDSIDSTPEIPAVPEGAQPTT